VKYNVTLAFQWEVRTPTPAQLTKDRPVPKQRFASSQFGDWQCTESTAEWKTIGVREITAPPVTRDLPTTVRAKLRLPYLVTGSSVHLASKCPTVADITTKSTSRVRSRQKNRLPTRPARRLDYAVEQKRTFPDCARRSDWWSASSVRMFNKAQSRPVSAK